MKKPLERLRKLPVKKLEKIGRKGKLKSAMYGEMPIVKIGKFNLSQMYEGREDKLWLENEEGEGMEFTNELLEPYIQEFFKKYF